MSELTEKFAAIADEWTKHGVAQRRAGKMTAQEVRTVKAVASAIVREIRQAASALKGAVTDAEQGYVLVSADDINRLRQWYNAVDDVTPEYLEQADANLLARLHAASPPPPQEGCE